MPAVAREAVVRVAPRQGCHMPLPDDRGADQQGTSRYCYDLAAQKQDRQTECVGGGRIVPTPALPRTTVAHGARDTAWGQKVRAVAIPTAPPSAEMRVGRQYRAPSSAREALGAFGLPASLQCDVV